MHKDLTLRVLRNCLDDYFSIRVFRGSFRYSPKKNDPRITRNTRTEFLHVEIVISPCAFDPTRALLPLTATQIGRNQ